MSNKTHFCLVGVDPVAVEHLTAGVGAAGQDVVVQQPQTRYARVDGLNIAYQVVGDGPFDLVHIPGFVSNVELAWEEPLFARFLERLASFSRLILFDKRGTGMSDRVPTDRLPSLEERMDDLLAVEHEPWPPSTT